MLVVRLSDVRLFEVEGSYTRLYFADQRVLIPKTLNCLESRLDAQMFFRASWQHIVNLQWVKNSEPWFSGGLQLHHEGRANSRSVPASIAEIP